MVVSPKISFSDALPPSMAAILSSNSRLALQVAILRRQAHRVAEGHAAADDADLGHRVCLGQDALDEGVTALVVGDDRLLGVADDAALALRAGHDALERLAELAGADDLLVAPRGEDGRLVDEVGQVRAARSRATGGRWTAGRRACRAACP